MIEGLISEFQNYHILSPYQLENSSRLLEISKKFHRKASIKIDDIRIESNKTIILESGHQPNFIPHAGTWKKAFLLANLQKRLLSGGNLAVAFFGFPDQNLSTARLLSRNQIPALNKKGVEAIGFRVKDSDRLKAFSTVPKPSAESWQQEIIRIEKFYADISNKFLPNENIPKIQLNQIVEILWKSYDLSENFAELNGYTFAKICHEILNIDLMFFFYSDMRKEKLFIDESRKILQNTHSYNQIYNRVIKEKGLGIPPVADHHMPFWYQCECGGKINLFLEGSFSCSGVCPLCKKEYHLVFETDFNNLHEFFDHMDFNAVSRNVVMAEGLGDSLFLSGVGGSLHYGLIADQISRDLGFHRPISIAWKSKDFYLGMTHALALKNLMKTFSLPVQDLFKPSLNEIICQRIQIASQNLRNAQRTEDDHQIINTLVGLHNASKNWPVIARNIFSSTPSGLDIFVNQNFASISDLWTRALDNADLSNTDGLNIIKADVKYHNDLINDIDTEEIPRIYQIIRELKVEECQKRS